MFLHGFTGSSATWDEVIGVLKGQFRMIAVDLTGHGKTSIPKEVRRFQMAEQLADLEALFTELTIMNFTLVGYSMGGRIALAYTKEYPKRVKTLILESASPGLKLSKSEQHALMRIYNLQNELKQKESKLLLIFGKISRCLLLKSN